MRLLLQAFEMLLLSAWSAVRLKVRLRAAVEQFYEAGNRSMLFVAVTLAFVGMIGVYQSASQMARVIPEYALLGAAFIQTMVNQMAPIMAGLLLATRVGTGMAAELGSMTVTDQVEAMKLSAVDPVELLVAPRVVACLLACLALSVFGCVVAVAAGCAVAVIGFSVLPDTFLSLRLTATSDIWVGLTKSTLFGLAVPAISCACGFEATGGSEGVGRATTRAVVFSSFAVILLNALVSLTWEVLLR